jgi:hypothetical protein
MANFRAKMMSSSVSEVFLLKMVAHKNGAMTKADVNSIVWLVGAADWMIGAAAGDGVGMFAVPDPVLAPVFLLVILRPVVVIARTTVALAVVVVALVVLAVGGVTMIAAAAIVDAVAVINGLAIGDLCRRRDGGGRQCHRLLVVNCDCMCSWARTNQADD